MECPACHANQIPLRAKLFVAARRSVECPACGVTLRFQRMPRIIHTVVGDGILLMGAAGAFVLHAPALLLLSGGVWTVLALALPLEGRHASISPDPTRSPPPD